MARDHDLVVAFVIAGLAMIIGVATSAAFGLIIVHVIPSVVK